MTRPARREGFSLIEALAALLIASMVLLAAYSLQREMTGAERRYERAVALAERQRTALVLIRDINPAAAPRGERMLAGGRTAEWTTRPLGDFTVANDGRNEVRLYRMEVVVRDPDGRASPPLTFSRVGWRPLTGPARSADADR